MIAEVKVYYIMTTRSIWVSDNLEWQSMALHLRATRAPWCGHQRVDNVSFQHNNNTIFFLSISRSMNFVNRYCTFQRNEPCALPAIVELIAGFTAQKPEDVALATAFNALKLFGLSQ